MVENLKSTFDHVPYGHGDELKKSLGDLMTQRSDVGGGICFGLSCQWIELHRDYHNMGRGEKYRIDCITKRIKDLVSDSAFFYRAMNSQAEYMNSRSNSPLKNMNKSAQKYNIQFDSYEDHADGNRLSRALDRTHTYHLISFQYSNGGHAICSYKSGGKFLGIGSHLYIFDANFGEFRVRSGQVASFFQAYFRIYGPIKSLQSNRVVFK